MRILFQVLVACLFLGACSLRSSAQEAEPQRIDCSKIFSQGCGSFNELLADHDKEVLDSLTGSLRAARVCFIEGEDDFLILSFDLPSDSRWKKEKLAGFYVNGPVLGSLTRYTDGVTHDSFLFQIVWHRIGEDGDPTAEGKAFLGGEGNLNIGSDETDFISTWQNKAGTTTNYRLSIRLATGRFKETYDWKDAKGKSQETDNTGHCFRYEDGVFD